MLPLCHASLVMYYSTTHYSLLFEHRRASKLRSLLMQLLTSPDLKSMKRLSNTLNWCWQQSSGTYFRAWSWSICICIFELLGSKGLEMDIFLALRKFSTHVANNLHLAHFIGTTWKIFLCACMYVHINSDCATASMTKTSIIHNPSHSALTTFTFLRISLLSI